jgi:catechol 2,3-dioxygenase-like lactoylglutathione lyase family enzyme
MKVGFMVMIQKQSNNHIAVEEPTITKRKKKKGTAGLEFNKKHAHFSFFDVKGIVHCEFVPPNIKVNSDFYCDVFGCSRENVQ